MDDGNGLTLNISCAPVATVRRKKPVKRPVEPTAPAVAARPAKQRKLDAGGGRHNARDKKFGGGRDANRPFLASLFSHNPTVPELSLPETTPAESDVFSGRQFSDLDLHPHLVANVTKALGGGEMTRVQKEALPAVLAGGDCLVRAQTGSGKTLAYLLPIVQGLQAMEPLVTRESGLFALVIVPTRELALQTHTWAVSLMKAFVRLVPGYLTGGERTLAEKRRLRRGLNLLVATPGRLLAHLASTRNLRLCALRWLVLDEADLLLDMGYERDVSSVVEAIREQRTERTAGRLQTIMLSATLDDRVKHLAGLSLSEPTFIDVASAGGATSGAEAELVTPGQLRQFVAVVPAKLRMVVLAAFLLWKCASRDEGKLVVFMNTQDMVDYHAALLESCLPGRGVGDLRLFRLHGSMSQKDRTGVFNDFKNARTGVLICTDVAARGVDLPRVHWIVQHTPPCRPADYVHRVGRTARAGGGGAALVLLTPAETGLVDLLRKGGLSVCDLSVETILSSLVAPPGRRGGAVEAAATQLQLVMEETVAQDRHLLDMARKAFTSLTRAYATYPAEMKSMLSVRSLHLGHYAKSLCLRETPTALGRWRAADPGGQARRKRFERPPGAAPRVRIPQASDLSEFQSGLDAEQSRKRKKKKGKRA